MHRIETELLRIEERSKLLIQLSVAGFSKKNCMLLSLFKSQAEETIVTSACFIYDTTITVHKVKTNLFKLSATSTGRDS